jgi:hypothetical protein
MMVGLKEAWSVEAFHEEPSPYGKPQEWMFPHERLDAYRLCFRWRAEDAHDAEIVGYHSAHESQTENVTGSSRRNLVPRLPRASCSNPDRAGKSPQGDAHPDQSGAARFGHLELTADLSGKVFPDLGVARHRLYRVGRRVDSERVVGAFALEPATVGPQVSEQIAAFHYTRTEVCSAPRGANSRLFSRR